MTDSLGLRAAQKLHTRQSLMEAAWRLTENQSLGSVSLRPGAKRRKLAAARSKSARRGGHSR